MASAAARPAGVLIAAAIVVLGIAFGISIASGPLGFVLLVGLTALWSVVFVGAA